MPDWRALALTGAASSITVLFWAAALWSQVPYLYSDGDTATWAWMLRHGEALYALPAGLPMRSANYPPLFLHAVAALAPSDEAILLTGSLLSLSGFLAALLLVGLCAARATGSRAYGLCAALLLGGTLPASYHASSCLPDAAGFGLVVAGIACASLRVRAWPILSALLFAGAILTKHSLLGICAGTCAWALLRKPRSGVLLVAVLGAVLGGALFIGDLFRPLVQWTFAPWQLSNFAEKSLWLLPLVPGLAITTELVRRFAALSDTARAVLGPWTGALVATLLWVPALGRLGSGANYTIEIYTVVSLLAVIAFAHDLGRRLFYLHAAVMVVVGAILGGYHLGWLLPAMRREAALVHRALADSRGPVFAESTWYTTRLGRPPLVIPYLARALSLSGHWSSAPLIEAVQRGEVERVVLGFSIERTPVGGHSDRLPPGMLETVRARYNLLASTDGVFVYGPR